MSEARLLSPLAAQPAHCQQTTVSCGASSSVGAEGSLPRAPTGTQG